MVHRFGADIAGGSEAHCRIIAERLAERHDVTVYTTTAKDHITWKNQYPPGVSRHGRLEVRRFPVARQRSLHRFAELSERVFSGAGSEDDEISGSGRTDRRRRSWSTISAPTRTATIACCSGRSATTRRSLAFRCSGPCRARADGRRRSGHAVRRARQVLLAAVRLRVPDARRKKPSWRGAPQAAWRRPASSDQASSPQSRLLRLRGLTGSMSPTPFVLYLGRIDPNKGCRTLLSHYQRYQSETSSSVPARDGGPGQHADPRTPADPPAGLRERRGPCVAAVERRRPGRALAVREPEPGAAGGAGTTVCRPW